MEKKVGFPKTAGGGNYCDWVFEPRLNDTTDL